MDVVGDRSSRDEREIEPDEIETRDHLDGPVMPGKTDTHGGNEDVSIRVGDEAHGADAAHSDWSENANGRFEHAAAKRFAVWPKGDVGGGRLVDEKAAAVGERALDLGDGKDLAVRVARDEHVEDAGALDVTLDRHGATRVARGFHGVV